ncbi:MAG TPA: twin-arginine translocase subunit TatC [Pirellulales bacterium]|jgi:sec-independent protein translocase protein TatC
MTPKPNADLFQDTTMTFGEHLDELRGALFKALLGLMLGCIAGFFLGDYMVKLILKPLEGALESYYSNSSIEEYKKWSAKREEKGLPSPYSLEQLNKLVYEDQMLFEIMYIDPRQALDEASRAMPQLASRLRLPANDTPPAADATSTPVATDFPAENARAENPADEAPRTGDNVAGDGILARLAPILLFHPASEDDRVHAKSFSFPETFTIWLKASLVVGTILSSPWVFYQIWAFVAAGLYPHERRYIHVFLPFSLGLFLLGAATAYLLVFKPVLSFLLTFNSSLGIDPDPRISEWLGFVMLLPLGFGISFQLPLVMLFLDRIGIFSVRSYMEKWRIAVLAIFIISAVLTPADPYSILFMAVPLTFLYFGGVLLCYFLPKNSGPLDEAPGR